MFERLKAKSVDGIGKVRISICLMNNQKVIKGNITKSFTIKNAKVLEVAAAIEAALFQSK
jgi:hypothetical protein